MSSVPKQFKTNEFQNGTFLRPSSYYKYRGANLQHSVVNNNETQSRNPRAVALSTHAWHARLRFNSSMSLLLGAFDLVYSRNDTKNGSMNILIYFFCFERQFPAMNILILHFLFWMAVSGHEHINFTFFVLNGSSRSWTY